MRNYSRCGLEVDRLKIPALTVAATLVLAACVSTPAPTVTSTAAAPAPAQQQADAAPIFVPAATPIPGVVNTPPPVIREAAPLIYTVQAGDTLWGIANRFLLDPWQWPEVWYVNDQIGNPHRIYPGDVLRLMVVNGRPQVIREDRYSAADTDRGSPQVRETPLADAVPMIPLDAIRDFLRGPRLVTNDELGASPYLLAFADENIVGGAGMSVYVQNLQADKTYHYAVVRRGKTYRDPDNGDLLGYEAVPVGEAEVREFGKPSTAMLSRTSREALIGDRLLPVEPEAFSENFFPRAPKGEIGGRIISVIDGFSQIGQYQIVTLNRGSNSGLEPGHVLDILQAGRSAKDPYSNKRVALPETFAGQLIVFKVTPRVSFGLVMAVTRPVHELDKVEKPVPGRR